MSQRTVRRSIRRSPVPSARRSGSGVTNLSAKLDGARARLAKLRGR